MISKLAHHSKVNLLCIKFVAFTVVFGICLQNSISKWILCVYLVALCEAMHLKASNRSFPDIAQHIVNDLEKLETVGVNISPGKYSKGAPMNITCALVHALHST